MAAKKLPTTPRADEYQSWRGWCRFRTSRHSFIYRPSSRLGLPWLFRKPTYSRYAFPRSDERCTFTSSDCSYEERRHLPKRRIIYRVIHVGKSPARERIRTLNVDDDLNEKGSEVAEK